MIDLRTHLISLVAVFLALGIGILIGIDLIGGRAVINQERSMITHLETDFRNLQTAEASLHATLVQDQSQLAIASRFAAGAVPYMVAAKLTAITVAVVVTSPHLTTAPVTAVLRQAGATLGPSVVLMAEPPANAAVWAEAGAILNTPATAQAVYPALAKLVAQSFVSGSWSPTLTQLEGLGIFKLSGSLGNTVGGVVLMAGSPIASDPLAGAFGVPLVRALRGARVPTVAGQLSTVPTQFTTIPLFQGLGVMTVDDLDLPSGQVSVVWGLNGTVGNYGLEPTAQALMPLTQNP